MPPQLSDLTTVAAAASWAGITIPSPDPLGVANNLQACLSAASIEFLRLTGRGPVNWNQAGIPSPFAQAVNYTETYNGNGNDELVLRNFPVNSIAALSILGTTIPSAIANPASPGFMIGTKARSIVLVRGGGYAVQTFQNFPAPGYGGVVGSCFGFPRGTDNIVVTYNAGFNAQTIIGELDSVPTTGTPLITAGSIGLGYNWLTDGGVKYFSNGNPLTPVLIAPAQGQYYVSNGVYLFNAADAGQQVLLSYTAAGTPSDIVLAVNQMVALNYKRRNWIGQRSVAMKDVGSTSYTLLLDPEILRVVSYYERGSL